MSAEALEGDDLRDAVAGAWLDPAALVEVPERSDEGAVWLLADTPDWLPAWEALREVVAVTGRWPLAVTDFGTGWNRPPPPPGGGICGRAVGRGLRRALRRRVLRQRPAAGAGAALEPGVRRRAGWRTGGPCSSSSYAARRRTWTRAGRSRGGGRCCGPTRAGCPACRYGTWRDLVGRDRWFLHLRP